MFDYTSFLVKMIFLNKYDKISFKKVFQMTTPKTICLKDYRPCDYHIVQTELTFEIFDDHTLVINRMRIERTGDETAALELDGERLELICLKVDDVKVSKEAYALDEEKLRLFDLPERCTVQVVTKIRPDENTELEGLYRSGGIYCTQCEPHGFRRITYFVDRPDNMSVFTTKIIAEKAVYPVLLGNGNLQETGDFADGRHYALWHDPFPKPSYLFALVAGDLGHVHDTFETAEGQRVSLNIYVDKGNEPRTKHAMRSLKAAMKWDEERYGRCYDLEVYNIVAVDSFNMGAMENKGLNIFNAHYVLADESTATDDDFLGIESVIAHEYFHNWTGNRITCRDWFQLTLKEGLTVFRDQCFSAQMHSAAVQRIKDVRTLRERQFPEDAGPTAHPIKPDRYIEINNFYTATVYEKGAEVIRMLYTMLGEERWRKAMDLYFETFDGQAVTTEDFLWAVQRYSPIDLAQFSRWYSQERTPELVAEHSFDHATGTLTLRLEQIVPPAVDGSVQQPYCYPLRLALLERTSGEALPIRPDRDDQPLLERGILLVRRADETFRFTGLADEPVLSLNRGFSAPIVLRYAQEDVTALSRLDDDGFVRYDAAQNFARTTMLEMLRGEAPSRAYLDAFGALLGDPAIDGQFKALLLELPSVERLMQHISPVDVDTVCRVHGELGSTLGARFASQMHTLYERHHRPSDRGLDAESIGARALKNRMLDYLLMCGDAEALQKAKAQYAQSATMTDVLAAMTLAARYIPEAAQPMLEDFYARHRDDTLVMTKYFAAIAASWAPGTLQRVEAQLGDAAFDMKVPNLVRALIGTFARNPRHFHAKDGGGYAFVAEQIMALDTLNPMIAAGLAGAFKPYDRLDAARRSQMAIVLEGILEKQNLSKNVYEIVSKILGKESG